MKEEYQTIQNRLKNQLKKERYEHTVGVMYTAASLAMCHDADIHQAMLAGLLHDCAKYGSLDEQIKRCHEKHIVLSEAEIQMPSLAHAKLGAYLAKHEYGITDGAVLSAIRYHTTGQPGMSLLEKIIYIADYIEPGRKEIPGLSKIRRAAFTDLDRAVALAAKGTIKYLKMAGKPIDKLTIKTYEYYNDEKIFI